MSLFAMLIEDGTPLLVESYDPNYEQNGLIHVRIKGGDRFRIPRAVVTTPIEYCDQCSSPMELIHKSGQEVMRCPNWAHHLWEYYKRASLDKSQYNFKQRRKADKLAEHYLVIHSKRFKKD